MPALHSCFARYPSQAGLVTPGLHGSSDFKFWLDTSSGGRLQCSAPKPARKFSFVFELLGSTGRG